MPAPETLFGAQPAESRGLNEARLRALAAADAVLTAADVAHAAAVAALPQGRLGYAEVTADQTLSAGTEADLTGLTVTVTVAAGRRIHLSGQMLIDSSVGGDTVTVRIKEGAGILQVRTYYVPTAAVGFGASIDLVLTPTAAAHTYKLTMQRIGGTGNPKLLAGAVYPAFLLAEDIGT